MLKCHGLVRRIMGPFFEQYRISGAQFGVLWVLYQNGEGLRLSDLGTRLLVRPPSVTGLIGRLEDLRLVERRKGAGDQREKHVQLTNAGRELVQTIRQTHPARIDKLMGGLSSTQQTQFMELLTLLTAHLEHMEVNDGLCAKPEESL
jgi:DNA-binding MarR family transcriptional regulator